MDTEIEKYNKSIRITVKSDMGLELYDGAHNNGKEMITWIWPSSAIVRNSEKALTNRDRVSSGTLGPYCRNIVISECIDGLSIAWQLKSNSNI